MFRHLCLALSFTFIAVSQVPAAETPGANKTLQAAQQFLDLADPFQQRFDELCGPIYRHASTLSDAELVPYLQRADRDLNRRMKGDEKISCYGQWANLIDEKGRIANVLKSNVTQITMPWAGKGKITVSPQIKQMRFSHTGRHLDFSISTERLSGNKLRSINVPEFSKLSFQILTEGKLNQNSRLPTSTQMKVLDETYRSLARQGKTPDKFTFLSKLILRPHEVSLQILSVSPVDWMGRPKKSELNDR